MNEVFWPTAFGAAIGVVAGVVIQYVFQALVDRLSKKAIKAAIRKECTFNLSVVKDIADAFRKYRDAINGDTPATALTYIPCDKGLHIQVNNLANNGRLYEFFNDEMLKKIQNVVQILSAQTGNWYFTELEKRKQALMTAIDATTKADTVAFLNFADGQAENVKKDLEALLVGFR